MISFKNQVAAITGAGSGIGRALALNLAHAGCHLALSDVNEAGLAETAARVGGLGVHVTTARVDVGARDEVHDWAARVVVDHGKCNLIFNNAGVGLGATVEGVGYDDFEWLMRINFWGVVHGTKEFLPHLRASGDGHVINISSVFGLVSAPGQGAYNAAKFAVRGYTEALREELEIMRAPVSATCVHPGGIKTNIARAARMDASMSTLGHRDLEASRRGFEAMFTTSPEAAADVILRGVRRNARRVLIGADAHVIDLVQRFLPASYQWIVVNRARRFLGAE